MCLYTYKLCPWWSYKPLLQWSSYIHEYTMKTRYLMFKLKKLKSFIVFFANIQSFWMSWGMGMPCTLPHTHDFWTLSTDNNLGGPFPLYAQSWHSRVSTEPVEPCSKHSQSWSCPRFYRSMLQASNSKWVNIS